MKWKDIVPLGVSPFKISVLPIGRRSLNLASLKDFLTTGFWPVFLWLDFVCTHQNYQTLNKKQIFFTNHLPYTVFQALPPVSSFPPPAHLRTQPAKSAFTHLVDC